MSKKIIKIKRQYYYDGYSTAEISQILSLNISTVQTRLARARAT
ncbi:RNA polymerase sigma factor [Eubacterium sp.]